MKSNQDSAEMKTTSDPEATPEPSASAQLFQITFYLGPLRTPAERQEVLSKNKGPGKFFLCECDDEDSLLLVSRSARGNKIIETPVEMKVSEKGTVSFHTSKPDGSFDKVEDLIEHLKPKLGLKKPIPRNAEQQMSEEDIANCARGRALYDYTAQANGDLTLKKGDEIIILDQSDGVQGWWTGIIGERRGLFPSTYIETIRPKGGSKSSSGTSPGEAEPVSKSSKKPSSKKSSSKKTKGSSKAKKKKKTKSSKEPQKGDVLVATYKHTKGTDEELSFEAGDEIILNKKDESGWWLGKHKKTRKLGWFPPALVELKG